MKHPFHLIVLCMAGLGLHSLQAVNAWSSTFDSKEQALIFRYFQPSQVLVPQAGPFTLFSSKITYRSYGPALDLSYVRNQSPHVSNYDITLYPKTQKPCSPCEAGAQEFKADNARLGAFQICATSRQIALIPKPGQSMGDPFSDKNNVKALIGSACLQNPAQALGVTVNFYGANAKDLVSFIGSLSPLSSD